MRVPVEVVQVDVDAVDQAGRTPLVWAITADKRHCEIVELLLSRGAYVDLFYMDHGTPLHGKHKQDATVKILLDHHSDVHTTIN